MLVGELIARLRVTDEFSQTHANADRAAKKTGGVFGQMEKLVKRAGAAIGVAVAAGAVAAVKFAAEYEASLTKINTLVGVNQETVERWGQSLLALSGEVARGPRELADALFVVSSAGQRGAEALEIVEQAAKASALGLGATEAIARGVTGAMNAYGSEVLSAAQATDILTAIVREGNIEAAELAPTLGRVIPIAAQLGVSFEEVGANIATFTRLGVNSAEAVTALRGILNSMLAPGKQAAEALAKMGLSAAGLREQLKEKGLQSVLETLLTTFEGNTEALAKVIPNVRALTGVLGTAGSQGEEYAAVLKSIENATGLVDTEFKKLEKTTAFQFKQATANAEAFGIKIGSTVLPLVNKFLVDINAAADGLDALGKAFEDVGTDAEKIERPASKIAELFRAIAQIVHVDLNTALAVLGSRLDPNGPVFRGMLALSLFNPTDVFGSFGRVLNALFGELDRIGPAVEELSEGFLRVQKDGGAAGTAAVQLGLDLGKLGGSVEKVIDVIDPDKPKSLPKSLEAWAASLGSARGAFTFFEDDFQNFISLVPRGLDKLKNNFELGESALKSFEVSIIDVAATLSKAFDLDTRHIGEKIGEGFELGAAFIRDFTGTAQGLLAEKGGAWGMAVAGMIELLEAAGLDINSIFNDILSGIGQGLKELFSDLGREFDSFFGAINNFLGVGGGGGTAPSIGNFIADISRAVAVMREAGASQAAIIAFLAAQFNTLSETLAANDPRLLFLIDLLASLGHTIEVATPVLVGFTEEFRRFIDRIIAGAEAFQGVRGLATIAGEALDNAVAKAKDFGEALRDMIPNFDRLVEILARVAVQANVLRARLEEGVITALQHAQQMAALYQDALVAINVAFGVGSEQYAEARAELEKWLAAIAALTPAIEDATEATDDQADANRRAADAIPDAIAAAGGGSVSIVIPDEMELGERTMRIFLQIRDQLQAQTAALAFMLMPGDSLLALQGFSSRLTGLGFPAPFFPIIAGGGSGASAGQAAPITINQFGEHQLRPLITNSIPL